MVVVENTPSVHNLVVCTLCSCYPWPVLGLPPVWYKAPPTARARSAIRAACCASSASSCRPTSRCGSGIPAPRCATWCCPSARRAPKAWARRRSPASSPATRMIGVRRWYERHPRHGRHGRLRPGRCRSRTSRSSTPPGKRRLFALSQAVPVAVPFGDDHLRREVERLPPADYLRMSYYEGWLLAIRSLLAERGILPGSAAARIATQPPLAAGKVDAAIAAGATTRQPDDGPDGALPRRRRRPRAQHPSCRPHPPAALCARQARRGGRRSRRVQLSRQQCGRARGSGPSMSIPSPSTPARSGATTPRPPSVCVDLWEDYLEAR